jgi:hypothetical protein
MTLRVGVGIVGAERAHDDREIDVGGDQLRLGRATPRFALEQATAEDWTRGG